VKVFGGGGDGVGVVCLVVFLRDLVHRGKIVFVVYADLFYFVEVYPNRKTIHAMQSDPMPKCRKQVRQCYADHNHGYHNTQSEAITTCRPMPASTNAPKELLNKRFFTPYVEEPPEPRLFWVAVNVLAAARPTGIMPLIWSTVVIAGPWSKKSTSRKFGCLPKA